VHRRLEEEAAAAHSEARVEVKACSEIGDEEAVCSRGEIEDDRLRRRCDRRARERAWGRKIAKCGEREHNA
jgi:hypothetical protein